MANFKQAVQWIALNDNSGDNEPVEDVSGYISVALTADLFGKDPMDVAKKVVWWRKRLLKGER
jgi:hypothetical protein